MPLIMQFNKFMKNRRAHYGWIYEGSWGVYIRKQVLPKELPVDLMIGSISPPTMDFTKFTHFLDEAEPIYSFVFDSVFEPPYIEFLEERGGYSKLLLGTGSGPMYQFIKSELLDACEHEEVLRRRVPDGEHEEVLRRRVPDGEQ